MPSAVLGHSRLCRYRRPHQTVNAQLALAGHRARNFYSHRLVSSPSPNAFPPRWPAVRGDRRVWTAMLLLLAGGMLLAGDQARDGGTRLWGLMAVLVATAAWGLDNTLSRALAERDPGQVVL